MSSRRVIETMSVSFLTLENISEKGKFTLSGKKSGVKPVINLDTFTLIVQFGKHIVIEGNFSQGRFQGL